MNLIILANTMNLSNASFSQLYNLDRRNHVFLTSAAAPLAAWDVGQRLSEQILAWGEGGSQLALQATEFLDQAWYGYGRILSLNNPGILLEPELGIDLVSLLDRHSQHQVLILHWPGTIDLPYLYFLTREEGITLDLAPLKPQYLPEDFSYEI